MGEYATGLTTLDLRDNALEWPGASDPAYETATRACRFNNRAACTGIPPQSCSAFRGVYVISMSNPNQCDVCTENGWQYTLAIMSVGVVVAPSLLLLYMWLLSRYPSMIKRWLSTIMIIISHAQVGTLCHR